jgi:hypothetical protein
MVLPAPAARSDRLIADQTVSPATTDNGPLVPKPPKS